MGQTLTLRNPLFYRTVLFLLLAELFSFFGYLLPSFQTIAFWVVVALAFAFTVFHLEYGVYVVLIELFTGSKGFLFSWEYDGALVSLRIALWLIVMSVWFAKIVLLWIRTRTFSFVLEKRLFYLYSALFLVLLGTFVSGFIRGNIFQNIFFDANGWLYFALLFPFLSVLKTEEQREKVIMLLFASVLWISLKAIVLFFLYAHDATGVLFYEAYRWVRQTGVGELTAVTPTFLRVFFQSQIFTLIAFFLLLNEKKWTVVHYALLVLTVTSTLLSFSRSFWVGGIVALFLFLMFRSIRERPSFFAFVRWNAKLISVFLSSIVLLTFLMYIPPTQKIGIPLSSLLEDRATAGEEAAVSSRWNLLPPLLEKIREHAVLGSGFGATVTYRSLDPRIVQSTAKGQNFYTTYAFEWGYLDLWLKFGLVGLVVYLLLIGNLVWRLFQKSNVGFLFGLVALLITNIFSPYLNHPLGIGYILLVTVVVNMQISPLKVRGDEGEL